MRCNATITVVRQQCRRLRQEGLAIIASALGSYSANGVFVMWIMYPTCYVIIVSQTDFIPVAYCSLSAHRLWLPEPHHRRNNNFRSSALLIHTKKYSAQKWYKSCEIVCNWAQQLSEREWYFKSNVQAQWPQTLIHTLAKLICRQEKKKRRKKNQIKWA